MGSSFWPQLYRGLHLGILRRPSRPCSWLRRGHSLIYHFWIQLKSCMVFSANVTDYTTVFFWNRGWTIVQVQIHRGVHGGQTCLLHCWLVTIISGFQYTTCQIKAISACHKSVKNTKFFVTIWVLLSSKCTKTHFRPRFQLEPRLRTLQNPLIGWEGAYCLHFLFFWCRLSLCTYGTSIRT